MDCVLLVRRAERRGGADGPEYVQLLVGDRTGSVPAVVWEAMPDIVRPGSPVHITGRVAGSPRQLVVQALRVPAPGTWRDEDLHDGPPRAAAHMEEDLRALVATVQDAHLGALLDRFFGEGSDAWARYSQAPAAKSFHQAYRHGLLEHSLTVAQAVSAVSGDLPRDRPRRRRHRRAAARHRQARGLRGRPGPHRPHRRRAPPGRRSSVGYVRGAARDRGDRRVPAAARRGAAADDPRPPRVARARLTEVVPCTREATLVHFIENLGGRLGSFDRLEKSLAAGERWSCARPRAGWDGVLPAA